MTSYRDDYFEHAIEKTVAEIPAAADFPEEIHYNGQQYEKVSSVYEGQGDGERIVCAFYSNTSGRGKPLRIEV